MAGVAARDKRAPVSRAVGAHRLLFSPCEIGDEAVSPPHHLSARGMADAARIIAETAALIEY